MITVNGVTKSYGTRTLFDNVTVKFTPGNRYGLTGPNGAGKSTFMKILTGDIEPSNRGTITKPEEGRRAAAGPVRVRRRAHHRHRHDGQRRRSGTR